MNKIILLFSFALLLSGCNRARQEQGQEDDDVTIDLPQLKAQGEITAVTLYSSTSYFQYKMQPMGYEYELIKDFARSEGLKLNIKVAESPAKLIEMLEAGEADVVAYPIQISNRMKEKLIYCGREEQDCQVLIQRANKGDKVITDVTELLGKDVYVKPGTKYFERLKNLDVELGGGIRIHEADADTVTTEDLIGMVSQGEIPYTPPHDGYGRHPAGPGRDVRRREDADTAGQPRFLRGQARGRIPPAGGHGGQPVHPGAHRRGRRAAGGPHRRGLWRQPGEKPHLPPVPGPHPKPLFGGAHHQLHPGGGRDRRLRQPGAGLHPPAHAGRRGQGPGHFAAAHLLQPVQVFTGVHHHHPVRPLCGARKVRAQERHPRSGPRRVLLRLHLLHRAYGRGEGQQRAAGADGPGEKGDRAHPGGAVRPVRRRPGGHRGGL